MNYYEHHLADYTQATAHLSMVEDAAYSRMLRWYYANEKPLPSDVKQVERLVRAQSKPERDAVRDVLAEFFELRDDGHHQDRADREIERFQDKQRKASASANARWNKSVAHSEGNANAYTKAMRTHSEGNAPQTPDPSHQTPDINTLPITPTVVSQGVSPGEVCKAMKNAGLAQVNPSNALLKTLIESGATLGEFVAAAEKSQANGSGFSYALGIVRGERERAAKVAQTVHHGAMPNRQTALEQRNRDAAAEWLAQEEKAHASH